ncbi:MAG: hypothetical protein COC19_07280 [SAR86 cluster bacterium]|uniref:Co-chaperone DjlA N-terminal domain-containing protein n=1 Tax=SAR86 cluster bacterium TaxID=2030880 RepID=A0A2A4MHR4_9GAMM|nr:MAG: hypothetical protein COC19_07280 [SAR86 cluster bacterium]
MFTSIKNFFESKLGTADQDQSESQLLDKSALASAALMIEVMNCDRELDQRETEEFILVLQETLKIEKQDLDEIIALAKSEAKESTSLFEFTRLINDNYEYSQKVLLIENMWRIAFSDETLDKYEDDLIRKVAELIYVKHSDFIRTKLKVRG